MAEINELELTRDPNRVIFSMETYEDVALNDPTQPRTFLLDHEPYVGALKPKEGTAIFVTSMARIFFPTIQKDIEHVRKGDIIILRTSNTKDAYQVWKPSQELDPGVFYEASFLVLDIIMDAAGYPILALEKTF